MTTKELKSYIDGILGNGIRCLLPSYWWRKALGAIVDKTEELFGKISKVENRVNNLCQFLIVPMNWDGTLTSTQQENNKALHSFLSAKKLSGVFPVIPRDVNINIIEESMGNTRVGSIVIPISIVPMFVGKDGDNYVLVFYFYTEKFIYTLHNDGGVQREWRDDVGGSIDADTEMSDTSENPVQNKVIKSYVDVEVTKKGNEFKAYVDDKIVGAINTEV